MKSNTNILDLNAVQNIDSSNADSANSEPMVVDKEPASQSRRFPLSRRERSSPKGQDVDWPKVPRSPANFGSLSYRGGPRLADRQSTSSRDCQSVRIGARDKTVVSSLNADLQERAAVHDDFQEEAAINQWSPRSGTKVFDDKALPVPSRELEEEEPDLQGQRDRKERESPVAKVQSAQTSDKQRPIPVETSANLKSILQTLLSEFMDTHENWVQAHLHRNDVLGTEYGRHKPNQPQSLNRQALDYGVAEDARKTAGSTARPSLRRLAKGGKVVKESIPVTKYTTSARSVPPYKFYRISSQSVIAPNRRHLYTRPHVNDDAGQQESQAGSDIDASYSSLDDVFSTDQEVDENTKEEDDELRNLVTNYGFKGRYRRRAQQLRLLILSQTYSPLAESFLEKIGCGHKDVLRYLLEPEIDIPGELLDAADVLIWSKGRERCYENFDRLRPKWLKVRMHLPKSSREELSIAGLACLAFHNVLGFSLWHIARSSEVVAAALARPTPPLDQARTGLIDHECAICSLVCCPYHGINLQRGDENIEVVPKRKAVQKSRLKRAKRVKLDPKKWYVSSDEESINTFVQPTPRMNRGSSKSTLGPRIDVDEWIKLLHPEYTGDLMPFQPCTHDGDCHEHDGDGNDCRCAREGIPCEVACGCNENCPRRYPGCRCAAMKKPCSTNSCPCVMLSRECDPDLCKPCCAAQVLDPENENEPAKDHCHNVPIQLGKRKHTMAGNSQVKGFGLYIMEAAEPNEFIGEYIGELMTDHQLTRNQAMTTYRKENVYLFDLKPGWYGVDARNVGNKTRFMNNSSSHKLKNSVNVLQRLVLCRGVLRIGLYAKRRLLPGEELFFDYGFGNAESAKFWEKGDKPKVSGKAAAVLTKNSQRISIGGQASASRETMARSHGKRSVSQTARIDLLIDHDDPEDEDYRNGTNHYNNAKQGAVGRRDRKSIGSTAAPVLPLSSDEASTTSRRSHHNETGSNIGTKLRRVVRKEREQSAENIPASWSD